MPSLFVKTYGVGSLVICNLSTVYWEGIKRYWDLLSMARALL